MSIARPSADAKTRMLANLIILWSGQVVTKALAFIAFAILARRLAPADYGAVEYAMGLGTIAALAVESGLAAVGVRRLSQGEAPAADLAKLIPSTQTLLAVVAALAIILFAWFWGDDPRAMLVVVPVAGSILLLPWRQEWLFQSASRMAPIVAAQALRAVVFAAGVLMLVGDGSRLALVGVLEVAAVAAAGAFLTIRQRSIAASGFRLAPAAMADLVREGTPISLSAAFWALMQYAPLLILAHVQGMADAAYFGAAHRVGVSLVTFSAIYHFNLYPTLARRMTGDPAAAAGLMRSSVRLASWGGLGLALSLALAADRLLPLLFGDSFASAAPAFQALIWVFPVTLIAGHARWALIAARRPSEMMWAQALGACVALALGWVLVRPFGALGAGISMTLASLSVWAATQSAAARHRQAPPLAPCVLPVASAGLLFFATPQLGLGAWASAAVGVVLYGLAALALDRSLLRELASLRPGASAQPGPEAA